MVGIVAGLSEPLRQIRAEFDPEDRYNEPWLDKMHTWLEAMTDEFTFSEEEDKKGDEGRLPEHDVIEMTEELYRETFFGPNPTKVRWLLVFTKKRRSQQHLWMNQYVVNVMRILADEYQGEVRFAIVTNRRQEKLREMFDVMTLPNVFLIEDGTVYEMEMLRILYNNIYQFIEPGERRDKQVYQSFPLPRVMTEPELKLKYVYNWVMKKWHREHYKDFFVQLLHFIEVPGTTGGGLEGEDRKNVWDYTGPFLKENFLDLRPDIQVKYLCYILAVAAIFGAIILLKICSCCKRRCCRKKQEATKGPEVKVSEQTQKPRTEREKID